MTTDEQLIIINETQQQYFTQKQITTVFAILRIDGLRQARQYLASLRNGGDYRVSLEVAEDIWLDELQGL